MFFVPVYCNSCQPNYCGHSAFLVYLKYNIMHKERKKGNAKSISYNTQSAFNRGSFICLLLCGNRNRYVFILERHKRYYSLYRDDCSAIIVTAFNMAEKKKDVFNNLVYLCRCLRDCTRNKLRNNQI